MPQGKTMEITQLRAASADLLIEKSYTKIKEKRKISKSVLENLKSRLLEHDVTTVNQLNMLDDDKLVKIVYGDKARLDVSSRKYGRIIIGKNCEERIDSPTVKSVDFEALVRRYSDNRNITKEDIYRDYVISAKAEGKDFYKRTTFQRRFNTCLKNHKGPDVYMHREHPFGDALELDWCGERYPIQTDKYGSVKEYYIMVMSWPASYYVYAELMSNMTTACACEAIRNALLFFGCKPNRFVVDNAKALVTKHKTGREAIFNETFEYFAKRCGIQIEANNPYRPNEKSSVEQAVHLIQTRVLTRMQDGPQRWLDEANRELMEKVNFYINNANFRGGGPQDTRAELFRKREKPAALTIDDALPHYIDHFTYLTVGSDYCVEINGARYSVPWRNAGRLADADISGGMVIIYVNHKEVARHPLLPSGSTDISIEHMPEAHQAIKVRELKYKTPGDVYAAARDLNCPHLLSFCRLLLEGRNFSDRKKGCISLINRYKSHPHERGLFEAAVSQIMHSLPADKINSYEVDKQVEELKEYARTHDGHYPVQTELPQNIVSDTGSFMRGNKLLDGINNKDDDNESK